jgi:hypothetical protein
MKNNKENQFLHPELKKQRKLVDEIQNREDAYNIVIADAFLRGMKDLGYKSTARAIDEIIDNSIQAGASNIHICFGFEDSKTKSEHPNEIVILDNGHGMDPEMIRYCLNWGGTHRANDRSGFGRYGYGLKSAAVSFGNRVQVYSKPDDGDWATTYLDINELLDQFKKDSTKAITIPQFKKAKLPDHIEKMYAQLPNNNKSGTIIVISKIERDRLTTKKHDTLKHFLLEEIGITYRHLLGNVKIQVEGVEVLPLDPLFIIPGALHYKIEGDSNAQPRPEHEFIFTRKNTSGEQVKGKVRIRYSFMDHDFWTEGGRGESNPRLTIRKKYNGIIVCRAKRQLDVVIPPVDSGWKDLNFGNNSRHYGVEIDFEPTLDEEFNVSTSKQGVTISELMWAKLHEEGVYSEFKAMAKMWDQETAENKTKKEDGLGKKASEKIMEVSAALLDGTVPIPLEVIKEAESNLQKKIQEEALHRRVDVEKVEQIVYEETKNNPFKIQEQNLKGAAFYEPESYGSQIVVTLNTNHRFYSMLYAQANREVRTGLELLIFVMAKAELRSTGDVKLFYEAQRNIWSSHLNSVLGQLELQKSLAGLENESSQ